ncbi:alpha/beta hydrolase [Pseudorhodobacter sp. W20_MBD10_FR17]|uniref:alpha/beta hydrolase n=1 Tax=Pseudorhodobacter sp. W20_MBD10_FR17 TaxID=3240266 RepID=UPI003F96EF7F
MEQRVTIPSGDIELIGTLHLPDDLKPGEKRPAFITTHGFGGSRIDGSMAAVAPQMCEWGYPTVRFDSRGCGESGGERGRIIPMEQVSDLGNVIKWLAQQDGVDPDKIIILGDSLGAAVSLYTGGTNDDVAAVIAVGGWGNGAAKIKLQHAGPGEYDKYLDMLARNKAHKEKTGESIKVSRFDIVPIPEHLRAGLPTDAIMEFPADTAQAIHDFRPIDVIGNLSPRPLLLLHASRDRVTPTEASIEVFGYAKLPKDMMLLSDLDHFPLAAGNARIYHIIRGWLNLHFPIAQ